VVHNKARGRVKVGNVTRKSPGRMRMLRKILFSGQNTKSRKKEFQGNSVVAAFFT
jgi:hypothetical protein